MNVRKLKWSITLLALFSMVLLVACSSAKQKEQAAKDAAVAAQKQSEEADKAAKQQFSETMKEAGNRMALSYLNLAGIVGSVTGTLELNRSGAVPSKDAIDVAIFINKDQIAKVKQEKAEIDKNMAVLKGYKETPKDFRVKFEAFSQWYDTYVEFFTLATEPPVYSTYAGYKASANVLIDRGALLNEAYAKMPN